MYRRNPLLQRLAAATPSLGAWCSLGSPAVVEIMALAGYDFIILDQEHGPASLETLCNQLRAMKGTPATSILRIASVDPIAIKLALDQGVEGIMVPNVRTVAEAELLVAAMRYPPDGMRGSAYQIARGSAYGIENEAYLHTINRNLVLMCQIESATAVDAIEQIAAVDGVDVVFLGLNDLGGSIGRLGQLDHPEVTALVERFEAGAKGRAHLGSIPQPGRSCEELFSAGYLIAAGTTDVLMLQHGAVAEVNAHRTRHG